jgi:hypothetical protein
MIRGTMGQCELEKGQAENATMKTDLDLDQSGERRLYGRRVYHLGSQRSHCSA